MTNDNTQTILLTTAEVSERYGGKISTRTLANWRSQGKGPKFLKLQGKVLYPLDEIVAWENNSRYSSTSNYRAAS